VIRSHFIHFFVNEFKWIYKNVNKVGTIHDLKWHNNYCMSHTNSPTFFSCRTWTKTVNIQGGEVKETAHEIYSYIYKVIKIRFVGIFSPWKTTQLRSSQEQSTKTVEQWSKGLMPLQLEWNCTRSCSKNT